MSDSLEEVDSNNEPETEQTVFITPSLMGTMDSRNRKMKMETCSLYSMKSRFDKLT